MTPSRPINNFKKPLTFIIIWVLVCGIGFYFRLYPLVNQTSGESNEKATLLILSNLRKTVKASVENKFPQVSGPKKTQMIQKSFNALLRLENNKVRETISRLAKEMDAQQPSPLKPPYLLASDSYNYYNLTRNIEKTGTISPTIQGSKYLNPLMLAPRGHWEPLTLHPFVGYGVHQIISFFKPDAPLIYTVSYTPLVIMALTIVPFLLICFLFRCSPLASFVGATYLVLAPIYIKRSAFGWYDNDPYNLLFPLAILAALFYGLNKKENLKAAISWACGCSLLISFYSLFWHGWVFFESTIIISGIVIMLFNHFLIRQREHSKNLLIYFSIIPVGTLLGISALFGPHEFLALFQEGWVALKNFLAPQLSLWPDLYISVGELRKASLPFIIDLTGGYLFFMISLLGLLVSLLKAVRRRSEKNVFYIIVITLLFIFSIIITLGAERFALLCLIPLSILFTLGVQEIFTWLKKLTTNFIRMRNPTGQIILQKIPIVCLSLVLIITPLYDAQQKIPTLLNQIFNDTWERTLVALRNQTPPDSIINTWWPPGHFIKAIAERKVTFDGATINVPQAYWIANMFLSRDEKDALGILRMLNNSGNEAAAYLQSQGWKLSETIDTLKAIIPLDKSSAERKLKETLTKGQTAHLLKLTHQTPPPSYIMIYNEMIEKSIELSFIANWDFKKIEEINADPGLRKKIPASRSKEYVPFLWKISGGQPRHSEIFASISQSAREILFSQGIKVDLEHMLCAINSKKFGKGIPARLLYLENNHVIEKRLPDANLSYSVVLFKKNNTYHCLLTENNLAQSLLVRLFYFEGKGLKYIEPFIQEEDLTKRTQISVYKIDWEKFLTDL